MLQGSVLLLVRHAEKPAGAAAGGLPGVAAPAVRQGQSADSQQASDPFLAVAGKERAQAYAVYFQNYSVSSGPPLRLSSLFAADDSPSSYRPVLTLAPLSLALDVDIRHPYADKDYEALAHELVAGHQYANAGILICWHHEHILQLAQALGVNPAQLPKSASWPSAWPGDVYGWVLQIVYDGAGAVVDDL
jgi:hypothetical protein